MTKLKLGSWQNIDFIFSKNNLQHVTINVTQLIFNASLKKILLKYQEKIIPVVSHKTWLDGVITGPEVPKRMNIDVDIHLSSNIQMRNYSTLQKNYAGV